jgi:hypothetical protein
VKAIRALGLLALLIGATFAGPLSTAELEPETGDPLHLLYDFEQPISGRDIARIHTSLFLGSMSGAGWRCEAVRTGSQWVIGPCRLMWTV